MTEKFNYASRATPTQIPISLTKNGLFVKSQGGHFEYEQKQKDTNSSHQTHSIHIGDNYGTITNAGHQSSLSINQDQNREKHKQTNIKETKPTKTSWLEILSWIIGISAGIVCIYEFIIKKFILKQ